MIDPENTSKAIASVAKDIYSDAVAPAFKVFGEIGGDAAKLVRLALFPLQYAAVFQDRLARRLQEAAHKVPEGRRITPRESIALQVSEKLRFEEDGPNPIADLYVNLLARAMDKERIGEAHPAFPSIISQLAPDEILVIRQLAQQEHRVYLLKERGSKAMLHAEAMAAIDIAQFSHALIDSIRPFIINPDELAQPSLYLTFFHHLESLGLTEYSNEPRSAFDNISHRNFDYFFIRLTDFGKLFYRACISDTNKPMK